MEFLQKNSLLVVLSLVGTALLLYVFRKLAFSLNITDKPNSRKIHKQPIPLVGGLALFIMMALLLFLSENISFFTFSLIIASGLVVLVGVLDDVFGLSPLLRFTVQIMAGFFVIYFSTVQIISFGYLLLPSWDLQLGLLAVPITIFGTVGVINALNMADGIDGLAAMTFMMPTFAMALLATDLSMQLWLFLIIICVFVFVLFNKSLSLKVFLGDNGSLLLGFVLAWLLIYFSQGQKAVILPVTALYLVAVAVYDTIFVMLRRIFAGKSPFEPDNTHLHHYFLSKNMSQTFVLFIMTSLSAVFIVVGLGLMHFQVPEYIQFYIFVLISALYYFVMQKAWS